MGGNWTAPDGVADSKFILTSNHVTGQGLSTLQLMYWNADSFNTNHYSQATLGGNSLTSAATYAGVAARVQTTGQNAYLFGFFSGSGNGYEIRKIVAGSISAVQTCTGTPASGDKLKLEANGTTLTAYVDTGSGFTQVGQATGQNDFTNGAAGMFGYNGGDAFTLDDFAADNVGGGGGGGSATPRLTLLGAG